MVGECVQYTLAQTATSNNAAVIDAPIQARTVGPVATGGGAGGGASSTSSSSAAVPPWESILGGVARTGSPTTVGDVPVGGREDSGKGGRPVAPRIS